MSDWEKEFDGYFMPRGYEGVIGLDPIEVKAFIRKTLLSSQSAHDEEICKRLEGMKWIDSSINGCSCEICKQEIGEEVHNQALSDAISLIKKV